jgi:hypothetical protein
VFVLAALSLLFNWLRRKTGGARAGADAGSAAAEPTLRTEERIGAGLSAGLFKQSKPADGAHG